MQYLESEFEFQLWFTHISWVGSNHLYDVVPVIAKSLLTTLTESRKLPYSQIPSSRDLFSEWFAAAHSLLSLMENEMSCA